MHPRARTYIFNRILNIAPRSAQLCFADPEKILTFLAAHRSRFSDSSNPPWPHRRDRVGKIRRSFEKEKREEFFKEKW
jgi:hypothetical protein